MDTYYKVKQADSLWVDYTCENWAEISNVWVDWEGTWSITKTPAGADLLSGVLVKSITEGVFQLRIPSAEGTDWDTLPIGVYQLNFQIECPSVVFKVEDTDRIIITAQEIV